MLGFGYFARDAVVLSRVTEDEVDAVVRGQRTHDVTLKAKAAGFGELLASCTCTPASLGTNPCRHLWAAILEIDRRGALACLRRSAGTLLLSDLVEGTRAAPSTKAPPLAEEAPSDTAGKGRRPGKKSRTKKRSPASKAPVPKKPRGPEPKGGRTPKKKRSR